MSKAYFISDAHLGLGSRTEERLKEDRLLRFLDAARKDAAQLFIVGDLFDAWIEYRTVIPKGFHRILASLDNMVHNGIAVDYLVGNHDFWVREYFRDELGMKTHLNAFDTIVNEKRIYIHHGDGIAYHDTGYRILKKVLRNRIAVSLYTWLHPDVGIALARSSSKTSRMHTTDRNFGETDGMAEFAKHKIAEGYDVVVMGHSHMPTCQQIGSGTYVNLGDWITHNTYAELDGNRIELKTWK
jgi:UDP-2,3-diacylglucosamine hydrolase